MENKKESAVEYLLDNIYILNSLNWKNIVEKAKAMEKEQIKDAHLIGLISSMEMEATKQAEQYYQENYGTPVDKKG